MDNIVEKINEASLRFLSPLPAEEMYKTIVEEARKLVDAEFGSIFLLINDKLERVYENAGFFKNVTIRNKGFTYTAFTKKKPFVVDVDSVPNFHKAIVERGVKSIVHVPLSYKNQSIGVLTLHSLRAKHFSRNELNILTLFGSLATLAIRKTQLYEETKRALETRDLFISLASHELRTPLTSINGYIQLLHSKLSATDGVEGKWIKELYAESGRLTNLVKELLEINRIKQGQLQFILTECNLKKVVETAVERLKLSNPERKITVSVSGKEGEFLVVGDFDKLLQMISAILSNAVKFSSFDSVVAVSLRALKTQLVLKVIDNGEGITKRDMPYIYDEFYRGINSRENNGLGVGLLMAKNIVMYHKGDLSISSEPNKGTIVQIKLPRL